MPSNYPTSLDDFANPAAGSTLANPPHHTQHGDLNDAIEAVEAELGLTPSGASATVAARLDASEVLRGTSFPAQPAYGNDRPFHRTDLDMGFSYDGTRWLSSTLYTMPFVQQRSGLGTPISAADTWDAMIPHPTLEIYVETLFGSFDVLTTNDGSNYWTFTESSWTSAVLSTISNAPNVWVRESVAFNAVAGSGATYGPSIVASKVGSPGAVLPTMGFTYRLRAT